MAGREPYSPKYRTALVLTGAGTAGAYHAGVLRALGEAGVRIDLVAGHGIGAVGAFFAVTIAWFAILFTGQYPRSLFDFVVGVGRWGLRVQAYTSLLVTDQYPPFSLS